jgi:hypothetical protein
MSAAPTATALSRPTALSAQERALVAHTVAQGATPAELQRLLWLADTYGLNPLKNELWFIKQPAMQRIDGQWTYVRRPDGTLSYEGSRSLIMTGRDGYLKIARAHADFRSLLSFEVCEGDHFAIDAQQQTICHSYGTTRGRILGAWARCEREGQAPVICYVNFEEYHRPGNFAWTQYPSAMIKKVAEVIALKRAFAISGLVTKEELGWAGPFSQQQPKPTRPAPQAAAEALRQLAHLRTLYQLEKHLQSLPQEVRQDATFAAQCRQRRLALMEAEKRRPATDRQLQTLGNMAGNQHLTPAERQSIRQHMGQYSYYTASLQIKSLTACIRARSQRSAQAA